jgi:hypothetical protein
MQAWRHSLGCFYRPRAWPDGMLLAAWYPKRKMRLRSGGRPQLHWGLFRMEDAIRPARRIGRARCNHLHPTTLS